MSEIKDLQINFRELNSNKDFDKTFKLKSLCEENFSPEDYESINQALLLAEEIHQDQTQPDGEAYIDHPVDVANIIIEKFKIIDKDLIISALLHDSMEDQSKKLFYYYMEKNNFLISIENILNLKIFSNKIASVIKEVAFWEIKDNFGSAVAERIRRLSRPDFEYFIKLAEEKEEVSSGKATEIKNSMYKKHFEDLLNLPDLGVGVVKCADFLNNVSKNHLLEDGPIKDRFIKKYGPVIRDVVLPFLSKINKNHPLYNQSQEVLQEFSSIYNNDFV